MEDFKLLTERPKRPEGKEAYEKLRTNQIAKYIDECHWSASEILEYSVAPNKHQFIAEKEKQLTKKYIDMLPLEIQCKYSKELCSLSWLKDWDYFKA
jgi:hypothetical protein